MFKRDNTTAQKMKFSIKGFFSKCDQIQSFFQIRSDLLKKSLMLHFLCSVKREMWNDCEEKVQVMFVKKLGLDGTEIEHACGVKRGTRDSNSNRPRPVVVKLLLRSKTAFGN